MTRSERRYRSISGGALLAAALGLFSARRLRPRSQSKRARGSPWRAIAASTPRRCARFPCAPTDEFDEAARDAALRPIGTGLFDKSR